VPPVEAPPLVETGAAAGAEEAGAAGSRAVEATAGAAGLVEAGPVVAGSCRRSISARWAAATHALAACSSNMTNVADRTLLKGALLAWCVVSPASEDVAEGEGEGHEKCSLRASKATFLRGRFCFVS